MGFVSGFVHWIALGLQNRQQRLTTFTRFQISLLEDMGIIINI